MQIEQGKSYSFKCDGEIVSQSCGIIKEKCNLELNQKLKKYNFSFTNDQLQILNSFNKTNAQTLNCVKGGDNFHCLQEDNCGVNSDVKTSKLFSLTDKLNTFKLDKGNCSGHIIPLDSEKTKLFSQFSCKEDLESQGIVNIESTIKKECLEIKLVGTEDIECKLSKLINTFKKNPLNIEVSNVFQKKCKDNSFLFEDDQIKEMNTHFGIFLAQYFSTGLRECSHSNFELKTLDQLICYKAEEYKTIKFSEYNSIAKLCETVSVYVGSGVKLITEADRDKPIDSRNIAGQPEKESFTLPTEAPVVKTQETLQKIDKLIADNGGEMTPEVARKAGEIFNSGIYQPTKNFINSVEQAITGASSSSGSSGRSSSSYKSTSGKSYEIGSKTSGRTVANITDEVPSAARASALNGKLATGGSSGLGSDSSIQVKTAEDGREAISGNNQNDKRLVGNNFSASQGLSGGSGLSGSVSSTGVGHSGFSDGGSASRIVEQQQLPSLSPAEKSEITKVVQALKGAESPEDVKSIVTGEDNYQQVKRMIQELEKSKTTVNSNPSANGRNPASTQVSSEVKEFEKTLEKFGIKVYGESGPGEAVYAPSLVNHVIVIKSNSVQFLNTIRSKK